MKKLLLFGLNGSKGYAAKIASFLDTELSPNTEQHFEDGESYIKSDVNVRNSDVYVVAGLYSDEKQTVNEKLVNLLWFCGSLKDASAGRITAVIPYFGYARQDRKTESRAPITTKYMARVIQSIGVDRVLSVDVHSLAAFQNSFKIPVDNLDTIRLFTDYLCGGKTSAGQTVEYHIQDPLIESPENLVALSPDIGGISRTNTFRKAIGKRLSVDVPLAVFDKRRVESATKGETRKTELEVGRIIGDVKGKRVLIYDDMIDSGGTVAKATEQVEKEGGEVYAVCAAHGLFTKNAEEKLSTLKRLIVTDTIPPWRLKLENWKNRLHIVPTSRLIGSAIRRTHEEGGSLSDLLES